MRYWKLTGANRVIAADCQMTPCWQEITREEFEQVRNKLEQENIT